MDKIKMPDSIDNALKNLTDKPTATIGETISDCLFLVFGGVGQHAAKRRARYAMELEKFQNELQKKIDGIPSEKLVEPNIHVICSAMDDMKYCVEERELRELFASLIANSLNVDKSSSVHPSFGGVVRQLTPFDARVFKWMAEQKYITLVRLKIINEDGSYSQIPNYYLSEDFGNLKMLQLSIDNLMRLRLIEVNPERSYHDNDLYDDLLKKSFLISEEKEIKAYLKDNQEIKYQYGSVEITEFGYLFYEACN